MATTIDIATLAGLLNHYNGKFVWIEWESNKDGDMNKTILKAGAPEGSRKKADREPNPHYGQTTCRYRAVMRNNFSFENRVRKLAAERNVDTTDWQPAETWGQHVPGTPFVLHDPQSDGVLRAYAFFLPIRWHHDDTTGYYVNGVRRDDQADFKARYIKAKKAPKDALAQCRQDAHPVKPRLDDTLYVRMGGQTYKLLKPTVEHIESLSAMIATHSQAA